MFTDSRNRFMALGAVLAGDRRRVHEIRYVATVDCEDVRVTLRIGAATHRPLWRRTTYGNRTIKERYVVSGSTMHSPEEP